MHIIIQTLLCFYLVELVVFAPTTALRGTISGMPEIPPWAIDLYAGSSSGLRLRPGPIHLRACYYSPGVPRLHRYSVENSKSTAECFG